MRRATAGIAWSGNISTSPIRRSHGHGLGWWSMPPGSTDVFRTGDWISGGELEFRSKSALEPALADEHGVAGTQGGAKRHHGAHGAAGFSVCDGDHVALGAGREAAGNRDGAF